MYYLRVEGGEGTGRRITVASDSLVFYLPVGEQTFRPMMTEQASVAFEGVAGRLATGLIFEQAGKAMRFVRVA